MAAWILSGASANETSMRPCLMDMEGTLHSIPCRLDSAPIDGRLSRVAGFSLHAGVACEAGERERLERLCRYLTRPAASGERLSLTPQGNIRYRLKTLYRDDTTDVVVEPPDFMARLAALGNRRHPPRF